MRKEVQDLVYRKVNERVAHNPLFAEAQQTISQRYPRKVEITEGSMPAVGTELAEDAETLAEEQGISCRAALPRVRARHDRIALQQNPPRTYKVGEVTFTEDPRYPVDMDSVETANRALCRRSGEFLIGKR